jgi:hypothetical protein
MKRSYEKPSVVKAAVTLQAIAAIKTTGPSVVLPPPD